MLEHICVFETPGSHTPGDAGSGPSNLFVLNCEQPTWGDESASWKSLLLPLREFLGGSTATLCEREGEVDKPQFMSNAKVMPCRNLCPVAGWG